MATPTLEQNGKLLNSWKEIANYLGRGVRTVQRYEHDLGLPVRRPRGKSRSAVIALTSDLDAWVRKSPMRDGEGPETAQKAVAATVESRTEGGALRAEAGQLRLQHRAALCTLLSRLNAITKVLGETKRSAAN